MHPTLIGPTAAQVASGSVPERARRATCRIGAYVSHPSIPNGLTVSVKDTSVSGAKIEVLDAKGNPFAASTERIPDSFTLVMPMERTMIECRVAWRKGHIMGVRYLGPATQLPRRQNEHLKPKPQKAGFLSQILKQI
jgi:hypothetical protein